mmetsp:Transcript_59136/g.110799  ORF Transcript_59136/g.110799 Transcript_59136/m.110799 type:complete len:283 (-) Transcript_59136:110-958(-)
MPLHSRLRGSLLPLLRLSGLTIRICRRHSACSLCSLRLGYTASASLLHPLLAQPLLLLLLRHLLLGLGGLLLPTLQLFFFVAPPHGFALPHFLRLLGLLLKPLLAVTFFRCELFLFCSFPLSNHFLVFCIEILRNLLLRQRIHFLNLSAPGNEEVRKHLLFGLLVGVRLYLHLDVVDGALGAFCNDGLSHPDVCHGHNGTAHGAVFTHGDHFTDLLDGLTPGIIGAVNALEALLFTLCSFPFSSFPFFAFATPFVAFLATVLSIGSVIDGYRAGRCSNRLAA